MTTQADHDEGRSNAGVLPPGNPSHLASLVDYAKGSIVSRILYRRGAGNLTLFAFDAGQELSEHIAPFDALVLVLDGSVDLTVGGKPLTLGAGEIVLMPANISHSLRAPGRLKMLLVMLRD